MKYLILKSYFNINNSFDIEILETSILKSSMTDTMLKNRLEKLTKELDKETKIYSDTLNLKYGHYKFKFVSRLEYQIVVDLILSDNEDKNHFGIGPKNIIKEIISLYNKSYPDKL